MIPHNHNHNHNHHHHRDPGSLHPYVPFPLPPAQHFAVKQGVPGLVDETPEGLGPPTFPAAKHVPGGLVALDQHVVAALAINELLEELLGGPAPVEPPPVPPPVPPPSTAPVPAPPPPPPPAETLPAAVPHTKFDGHQAQQLKQLISILFPVPPGSSVNAAAAAAAPAAADHVPSAGAPADNNTVPADAGPSTVQPVAGPAAGVPSTFSAPAAPVQGPDTAAAAPVPVADSVAPVAPTTSADPARPPPETIAAAAPAQNDNAQVPKATPDAVPATTVVVPVQPQSS